MSEEEWVKPETDEEKLCFNFINDLHHVSGHVQRSISHKKYMCNEIWSLISYLGASSWFITFSPVDNMHPISLYYADTNEKFSLKLRLYNDHYRLISQTLWLVLDSSILWLRYLSNMCSKWEQIILADMDTQLAIM